MASLFTPFNRILAFIGRHGTVCFALSIFLGLALPQLASRMRPMLAITIFVFIMLNFARTDGENLRATLARPARFAIASLWSVAAAPLLMLGLLMLVPRETWNPDILLAVAFYAASPSLMGCPAYATLLGFRNGLITAILFVSLTLSPLLSPVLTNLLVGHAVPIDPLELGLRLLYLVGSAIAAGILLRRFAGPARMIQFKHQIDGIGIICYFLFAITAMDGVIDATMQKPLVVAGLLALNFAMMGFVMLITLPIMARLGTNDAFTLSLGTGLRNIGIMVATMGAATPKDTYLFFALAQFPVYMAPLLVSPLAKFYRRRMEREALAKTAVPGVLQGQNPT